jgi:hypothetical protein
MAHSVAKFATTNPIAEDVDGKIFTFIGDRLSNQEPQAILIPTNAWTTWTMHKVGNNVKMMTEHYKDKQNYGSLYQEGGAKTNKHVPNILAILLSAVKLFSLHRKGKMPHECLDLLMRHVNDPDMVENKDEWNLTRDWLLTPPNATERRRKNQASLGLRQRPSHAMMMKYDSGSANV